MHLFKVYTAFIGERMKDIVSFNRTLFTTKDKINPKMKVIRDIVTF